MADTGGYAPAWQTEDLAEEWIERSASSASASGNHSGSSSSPTTTHKSFDSTKHVARASGYQGNSNINSSSGMRIVSGHTTFPSPHPHPSSVSQSHQSTSKKQSSVNVTYDAAPSPPTSHRSGSVSSGSGRSMTIPIPAHDGRSIGDTSTIPAGTFLVKPENEDIAPVGGEGVAAAGLKRNPFVAGGGDIGGAAADGGLFQRLELERLFDPPREPVVVGGSRLQAEEPVEQGDVDEERQNALPIMMGSPAGTTDQHSTIPLRRTSHSYVPVRPSRLSNSMTPPSANSSMVSSSSSSPSSGGGDPAQAGLSRTDSALRYDSAREDPDEGYAGAEYDSQSDSSVEGGQQESSLPWLRKSRDDGEPMTRQPRRFSGEEGSMRDVEFTFSPSPIRKRPSAQTLVTHTSRSVSSSVSPATKTTTTTAAGGKKLPFRLFQRQVDSEGWDTIQSRDLIERITVGGTPLKDLVRRAGAGGGSPSPVHRTLSAGQRRRDSGFTADADRSSVQRGRRHRNPQLAKQWSSSSGSDGASSASGSREKLEEESEVLEERSAKRIRLSRSPSSSSGRHRYHQQVAGEYEEESPVRAEEERHAATGATQYQYSASGSEDARDQHQYHHTADSFLSASRSRASQSYTRRMQQNPEQSSSVSDVGVEDEDVANRSNGQPSVPPQGQRTSWGEKGEELLQRIRQGQGEMSEKSDTWTTSWSRSSVSAEGKQPMQEGLPPTPPLAVGNNKRQVIEQGQQGPYGTVTSSNSGGTASSSSTITSRYLSAGINMLEKIKERKVSDSSGTGACTDGDARTETQESRCGSEEGNKNGWAQERGNRPGYSGEGATVSSQSTIRGGPARQLSGAGSVDLQGSVKSRGSGSSTRSSFVASLGKGAAPTNLRTIAESPSVSVTYTRSEQDVAAQPGRPIQQIPRVPPVQQEDMNRYISSTSTANTATTAVSTSFVKHRGPPAPAPHGRAQGVRTIGLNDIPQIPRQVGNMVFDPVRGWVKATRNARNADQEVSSIRVDESKSSSAESMDIFAGMESLRDEESTPQPEVPYRLEDTQRRGQNLSPVLEASMSQAIQEETVYGVESEVSRRGLEQQIDSQRQPRDSSDGRIYNPAVSSSAIDDFAYLSINRETAEATSSAVPTKDEFENGGNEKTPQKPVHKRPELHETVSAPTPLQTDPVLYTPAVRSILKTGSTEMSAVKAVVPTTPLSAIKIVSASEDSARRSVSFSDGQTHGKIREHKARHAGGASRRQRNWTAVAPEDDIFNSQDGSSGGEQSQLIIQPSVRSKRIQNMLTGLQGDTETPSKTSISGHSRKLSLLSDPSPDPVSRNATSEMSFNTRVRGTRRNKADATFLTECSFGVAHDKLVELITEVQPFEPHWDQLTKIDLSKRGVDSVARLKEFCPDLDEANLNNNHISYLSGLPASLRRLHISSNKLTNVSSVDYLANLQYLDVSHNQIDSVNALSCLKHLRELRLDYNQVQDLKDIMGIDSLVKLSCKGNAIKTVDFSAAQWPDMECLDLSRNQIAHVEGLESLKALTTLNLDHNRLSECNPAIPAQSLRALRLSHNRLKTVDMSKFPRLRSLYADGNQIRTLVRSSKHSSVRLEYLSLRDQDVSDLDLSYADLRDVKRLYISGNRLSKQFFPTRPLYSLVYLEAAACSLSEWPEGFGQRVPNLRILNMNYNFIENLSGIEGLQGLRKLMMIGCRLGEERSSSVLRSVRQIGTLEEIDLRMNPLNLNFYLPLILNEASPTTIIYPAEANSSESVIQALSSTDRWAGMDDKFRQLLPDRWYFKRLVYRGALKLACDTINVIDGIHLTQGEMRKAIELMEDAALRGKTAA